MDHVQQDKINGRKLKLAPHWLASTRTMRIDMTTRKKSGCTLRLQPIGVIRSTVKDRSNAAKQGSEGAPDVWLELKKFALPCLEGLATGQEVIVITWLHNARRNTMKVHPRSDPQRRLMGVFATRSPDRPNPLGLHHVTIRTISGHRLRIGPMEAIDGTPVVDIKPVLCP
jgi:tRNA-Thr(GGU) m(6)t(6)A37 methyltransferase TsaA